jgi:hypothetical protein
MYPLEVEDVNRDQKMITSSDRFHAVNRNRHHITRANNLSKRGGTISESPFDTIHELCPHCSVARERRGYNANLLVGKKLPPPINFLTGHWWDT